MFAFIDIVNILGGIDITLEEDLVDPTYRVRNNGIWSTLYYSKGTHHLDGIETLRVARARHFTPLFSRDDRQQKIIAALIDRISGLSIADFNKVYDIIKTVLVYLDTDMTIQESVSAVNFAGNIKKINKTVLSTSNVLVQTYSGLLKNGQIAEQTEDIEDLGAWILVPENNDWNAIHEYIQLVREGKQN